MGWVWSIFAILWAVIGSSWLAMVLHESSHYLCGRAVGVPRRQIALRLNPRKPHVALRDDEQWRDPDHPGYVEAFTRYQSDAKRAWLFIAAGAIAVGLALAGLSVMALILMGTSTAYLLIYVVADAILSYERRRPHGDFSSMWRIGAAATVVTAIALAAIRGSVILLLVDLM